MGRSVAYREPSRRRRPCRALLESTFTRRALMRSRAESSDRTFRHAARRHSHESASRDTMRASPAAKVHYCRSHPTATAPTRLQYSSPFMKSKSLSSATMRVSRLLSCTALFVGLVVLGGWAYDFAPLRPLIPALMTPQTALCISLLALAALLSSLEILWTRIAAQTVALIAAAVALESLLRPWLLASPYELLTLAGPFPGGIAYSTCLICLAAALALACSPHHSRCCQLDVDGLGRRRPVHGCHVAGGAAAQQSRRSRVSGCSSCHRPRRT